MNFIYLAKSNGGINNILNIISLLLMFALVLFLSYITARFVGKYQAGVVNSKSNIRVIESFRLGNNKFIAIVKIADEYYAIGIGKEEITLLDKVDKTKLQDFDSDSQTGKFDFKSILSQVKDKEKKESKDENEK